MTELVGYAVDFVLHLDQHLGILIARLGPLVYAVLFLIVFCETGLVFTPFLPGDSLLFAVGTLASRGSLDVWLAAILLVVAAIVGDAVNYWIGRLAGEELLRRAGGRWIRPEHIERTHAFYERHGAKTIVLARFVPIIRTFAPFVAGFGRMTYTRFTLYNVTGGLAWVGIFVFGGYFFGNLPFIQQHFSLAILAIIAVSVLPMLVSLIQERRRPAMDQPPA